MAARGEGPREAGRGRAAPLTIAQSGPRSGTPAKPASIPDGDRRTEH